MIKLTENTFRFVSIAFANEMGLIGKALGLNIWEVIAGAKTKGFGLDICYPGLIGGHCIPIDPHYLGTIAREEGLVSAFIDNAELVHQNTKREARELIQRLLNQNNKGISGSRILFLGAAYKKNIADVRESPSLDLMKELFSSGAIVTYWDPLVQSGLANSPLRFIFTTTELRQLPKNLITSISPNLQDNGCFYVPIPALAGEWNKTRHRVLGSFFDCIVISTDHDIFHAAYEELVLTAKAPPIADLRNAINVWLSRNRRLSSEKTAIIRQALSRREKYMLLSVH